VQVEQRPAHAQLAREAVPQMLRHYRDLGVGSSCLVGQGEVAADRLRVRAGRVSTHDLPVTRIRAVVI
jgi:hypothetical protein